MSEIRKDIKSFEELFKTGSQIKKENDHVSSNGIDFVTVPIKLLKPFLKHPFKLYTQDKLMEMAESIKLNGVIVPVIIRPIKGNDYEYEIISGHNRVRASTLAGLDTVPCSIKDVDDDTAVLIMIDTNLQQREIILPSEKAFAYKYKYEAIKSKGKRNDLTSSQVDTKLQNDDFLAKESNESKHTMYRYIRLTHLIPQLLDKVDERKIPFIPAVDLSYLSTQEQKYLLDILIKEEHFNVTLKQSAVLKAISQKGNLTYEKINKIIRDRIYQPPSKVKISYKKIKDYFPDDVTPKQLEALIIEALELWSEQKKQRRRPKMNIHYTEKDGILYPDFRKSNDFKAISNLGKYGRMALRYLKKEYPHRILEMKINGELMETLSQVDTEANEMMITLQKQMLKNEPFSDPRNFMESVRRRNGIHVAAEEIVLSEIVFQKR